MKQPKKLTLKQKQIIRNKGMNPKEWMVRKQEEGVLVLIHKETNKTKVISMY